MRTRSVLLFSILAAVLWTGCGKKTKVRVPVVPRIGSTEEGLASWYGHPYHGRRAANGEIYDMEKLTAAHRTLPFDTWVEVHNKKNGKVITVRITDRGPFIDGRIIDLSRAAARSIEMLGPGVAPVRLVVTSRPADIPANDFFTVQVGAFVDRSRADQVREDLRRRFGDARVARRDGQPPLYRVLVGGKRPIDDAKELVNQLREQFGGAFIVRADAE